MVILPLAYADFIAPQRANEQSRILRPDEIPIHPKVYVSDFAFTPEFVEEVRRQMPRALHEDISEIERVLGKSLGLYVTDTQIAQAGERCSDKTEFAEIGHEVDPTRKTIDVGIFASTINILRDRNSTLEISPPIEAFPGLTHPLPLEKVEEYAFKSDGRYHTCHTWYTHNLHDQGKSLFHYLRTFAIVFNNTGLERIARSS